MNPAKICGNLRNLRIFFLLSFLPLSTLAQQPTATSATLIATPVPGPLPEEETIVPTFETQKLARTYILDVPAPRGQITDRNGLPLAQNKISYSLAINFPTPLDFSDAGAISFAREKIEKAAKIIGRPIKISDDAILRHYRNRGILPFEIVQNLDRDEYEAVKDRTKD